MEKQNSVFKKILVACFVVGLVALVLGAGYLVVDIFGNFGGTNTKNPTTIGVVEEVESILLKDFYYGENSQEYQEQLIDDAINGMVNAQGDPHTTYFTAAQLDEFLSSLESSFVGIGISYSEIGKNILVRSVLEFSPAQKAGLQPGDIIVAVDGLRCEDSDIDTIVSKIAGKEGTDVIVTVLRDNEEYDYTITRASISNTVSSDIKGDVGVLTISQFASGTANEVKKHLEKLESYGVKKLVIDLRDDTGGYASTLFKICAYFMDNGDVIMREYDRDNNEVVDKVTLSSKFDYEDIVVLVNENSASCSEVFALALKENCGATIVGVTTYGKGVAQVTKSLSNGGALKYTDVIWKSGNGQFIDGVGITPDYEVRLPEVLYQTILVLEDDETYSYDCVSNKVSSAQMMLEFLGYNPGRTDGYFSQQTVTALKNFQKTNGLEVSGKLDEACAVKLNTEIIEAWATQKDKYDWQMNKALEILN